MAALNEIIGGRAVESNLKSKIVAYCRMRLEEYLPNFPVALYHYTSAEAMLNIVKSGKLWVHNIEHLNDKTELRHATSIFRARLDLLRAAEEDESVFKFLESVKARLDERFSARDAFVASFVTDGDEAAMWRLYGDRGKGFSFAMPTFKVEPWNSFPCKCQYDDLVAVAFCDGALNVAREAFKVDLRTNPAVDYAACAQEFLYNISYFAALFKQKVWAHENEFRLFFLVPPSEHQKKENGNTFITVPKDGRLPIEAICAGPCCDYSTQAQLKDCLANLGQDIPLYRSKLSSASPNLR